MGMTVPQVTEEDRRRLLNRLRRLEGQVRGVQRMLEQGRDCEEIVTQLAAVKAAVHRIAMHLVAAHMEACVEAYEGKERQRRLGRLARTLAQL